MAICVMCSEGFDSSATTFEQRLVNDDSFCMRCWTDIMNGEYDSDFDFNLAEITQKRREG
jgi:hypothetical protein